MMTPLRRRQLLAASRLGLSVLAGGDAHFYNADQPRDGDGRWASTAAQGGLTAATAGPGDVLRAGRKDVPTSLLGANRNWAGGLAPDDKWAVMKFTTGEHHDDFNKPLRADPDPARLPPAVHREAAALDRAIRAFPAHAPVTSWRGLTTSTPDHLAAIETGLKAALAAGAVVTMNGFTSSSLDPGAAGIAGPVVLELKSSRGAYLGDAARHPEALEVLHTHGEQFRVTGVHETTYGDTETGWTAARRTYTLEALPVGPPPFPPAPVAEVEHPGLLQRLSHAVGGWLSHADMSAEPAPTAARFWDPDQPRSKGRFASKSGGGEGGEATPPAKGPKNPPPGGATKSDGTHDVKLPKNPKRLNIAEAHTALTDMGYTIGKESYNLKAKTSLTDLTHPDGTTSTVTADQVKALVYGGKRAAKPAPDAKAAKPASIDELRQRLKDAETKVAAAHAKADAARAKAAKPVKPTEKPAKALPAAKPAKPAKPAKTPKAVAPAQDHAATAAHLNRLIKTAATGIMKGNGKTGMDSGPGAYDKEATHKAFDDAMAGAKTKKDLMTLLKHMHGKNADDKWERWMTAQPRRAIERHFKEATHGRIGSLLRAMI